MVQKSSRVRQREQIEWRQQKVLELTADGHTIREIESILKVPRATVGRDIVTLRQQAKDDIHKYITDQVPYEYKKTLAGLEGIIKYMSSIIADDSKETKEKMQAASIKMQALNMKVELVSSTNLVEEAIDLVQRYQGSIHQKGQQIINGNSKSA
jgi:hypothetical protein